MKSIAFMQKLLWLLVLSPFLLSSCQDKMDEHYEKPEWLKGSTWEVLESEENYSVFLELAEKAGFRPYMEGKGILTIMAPDDEAFTVYLNQQGYDSVEDMTGKMSAEELKKLVGFHLLYYSYTKNNLENFRPEGQGALDGDEEILDAGMYYKFRTRSTSPTTTEYDAINNKDVTIYHLERFIPVFSYNFFEAKKIDAKSNYEYFYPNSTWTGSNGFNVSEATVTDYEVIANNGYVYKIDRVLEPLETIYEELKKNPDYSDFLAIYNNYSYFEYDETISSNYGDALGVDSLYLHKHSDPLPPIALEWPVSNYQRLDTLAYKSYSVFAPSNKALSDFYDNYFSGGGYESITSVDPLILSTLLSEYVYGGSVVFPEEITSGKIVSSFGTTYNFDPYSSSVHRKMCVNGSFYGLDDMDGPDIFTSVAGPAFRETEHLYYLYALSGSEMLNTFGSKTQDFTLLIPTNQIFTNSDYYLNSYDNGNVLEVYGKDGLESANSTTLSNLVQVHTKMGEISFPTSGIHIYENMIPYQYWYVKDGKITSSATFSTILEPENAGLDPFVEFREVTNNGKPWTNGKVYAYDSEKLRLFESGMEDNFYTLNKFLSGSNDRNYLFYAFGQLLKKAGLVSGETITSLAGRVIAFIPSNEAIMQALEENKIPGVIEYYFDGPVLEGTFEADKLKEYLNNYFIAASQIISCPYPGSGMENGEYMNYSGNYIIYTDHGNSLSVRLKEGTITCYVIPDYDYFPFTFNDGCIHFIDSIF